MEEPELTDGVVTLRVLQLSDIDTHIANQDEDFRIYINEGYSSTPETETKWITRVHSDWEKGGPQFNFGIRDASSDELVGNLEANIDGYATDPSFEDGDVNISYSLGPAFRGKGYVPKAMKLILAWVNENNLGGRAILVMHPDNTKSRAVAEHLGFTFEKEQFVGEHGEKQLRYFRSIRDFLENS